jgi:hypothetical protein
VTGSYHLIVSSVGPSFYFFFYDEKEKEKTTKMKRVAPQSLRLWTCVSTRGDYRAHTDDDNAKKRRRPRSPIISLLNQVKMWKNFFSFFFVFKKKLGFLFQYISVCGATGARFRES